MVYSPSQAGGPAWQPSLGWNIATGVVTLLALSALATLKFAGEQYLHLSAGQVKAGMITSGILAGVTSGGRILYVWYRKRPSTDQLAVAATAKPENVPNFDHLSINEGNLNYAPQPVTTDFANLDQSADKELNLNELLDQFDLWIPANSMSGDQRSLLRANLQAAIRGPTDLGPSILENRLARKLWGDYQAAVNRKQRPDRPEIRQPIASLNQVEKFLCALLIELKKPSLSPENKRFALECIADKVGECQPTWVEESKRALRLVKGIPDETPRNRLLRYVQSLKEDLILELHPDEHWHVLNNHRLTFGEAWGLDSAAAKFDRYAHQERDLDKQVHMMTLFQQAYTPQRLIAGVTRKLAAEGPDPDMVFELSKIVAARPELTGDPNADETAIFEWMDKEGAPSVRNQATGKSGKQLTELGVSILLRSIGILSPPLPAPKAN